MIFEINFKLRFFNTLLTDMPFFPQFFVGLPLNCFIRIFFIFPFVQVSGHGSL
jgi:hypothetical protein